jgi:predicted nucleotidyltransferase
MNNFEKTTIMLTEVAKALGEELLEKVAFVGGCATGLLIQDEITRSQVRFTEDVDLITSLVGLSSWHAFQSSLIKRGFSVCMEDDIQCRMRLNDIIVDFMPDDEAILGFTNRWYSEALKAAEIIELDNGQAIRLVSAPYFLATKLEAYKGRGQNDPLTSKDIEDILNIINGRNTLVEECYIQSDELKLYLQHEFQTLLKSTSFQYAIQSAALGDDYRERFIYDRVEDLVLMK